MGGPTDANNLNHNHGQDDDTSVNPTIEAGDNSSQCLSDNNSDNGSNSNSNNNTGETMDNRTGGGNTSHNRWIVRAILAIGALCIVAGAITAGVLVRRRNERYSGPVYRVANQRSLEAALYQECYNSTEPYCEYDAYGSKVRMSADGTRIFVSLQADHELRRERNLLQVLEWNQTSTSWYRHSVIPLKNPNDSAASENQDVVDFEVDQSGTRLVVSTFDRDHANGPESNVYVYEEECCNRSWKPIGNITFPYFQDYINTMINSPQRQGNLSSSQYGFASELDMSADGNTIAVAHPSASFYGTETDERDVGCVLVFRHHTSGMNNGQGNDSSSEPQALAEQTWIPIGPLLRGYGDGQEFGTRIRLINETHILVFGNKPYDQCRYEHDLNVYNYEAPSLLLNGAAEAVDFIDIEYPRLESESEIMTTSPDGKFLVVADADYSPSAYEDKPYQGRIQVYMMSNERQEYDRVAEILGDRPFLHLGTSIAIAADYTIVAGTGTTKIDVNPQDELRVFRYQTTWQPEWSSYVREGHFWIDTGYPFSGPHTSVGWLSVDISANGKFVVAGAPDHFHDPVTKVLDDDDKEAARVGGMVAVFQLD